MSSVDPNKTAGGHEEFRADEDLLERILAGDEVDSVDSVGAGSLAEAVQRMRGALGGRHGGVPDASVRELRQRILAQTTREDLSWRGDLRLVGRFMGSGMRRSPLLRVAAASLLFHLAALPLLAYWAWSGQGEDVRIGFETHEQAYPEQPFPDRTDEAPGQLPVPGVDQEPVILDGSLDQAEADSAADAPRGVGNSEVGEDNR